MSSIIFNPWIGSDYETSEYGKLLLIGDSHYFYHDETDFKNFTKEIIQGLGTENDNDFYVKIGKVFNANNYLYIWSQVAFANAIQVPFTESRPKITSEAFKTIEPAIKEYLSICRPEKMIVFSVRVWDRGLFRRGHYPKFIKTIHDPKFNKSADVFQFEYKGGTTYGIKVNHPSSSRPSFVPEEIKPLIDIFLESKY